RDAGHGRHGAERVKTHGRRLALGFDDLDRDSGAPRAAFDGRLSDRAPQAPLPAREQTNPAKGQQSRHTQDRCSLPHLTVDPGLLFCPRPGYLPSLTSDPAPCCIFALRFFTTSLQENAAPSISDPFMHLCSIVVNTGWTASCTRQ